MLAVGLTFTAGWMPPAYCRVVTSAQSFRYYFRDLKQADATLSPLQRFVFSLVLANEHARTGSQPQS